MPVYAICYDLNNPGQEYDELYNDIKKYGSWWHHLDSTWLVETSSLASDIRDDLKSHLDSNDELLVVKLSGAWASSGVDSSGTDWLYDHL
ncbi:hypothetical protein SAMN05444342_4228 [Haladaptatus paucihalophilus DX253]|uniref:SinR family protein n=1 Tax=Haladaptatus paucihalophilus DX253 TaxID=797209 RepID=A0A1M7BZX0_HALPU|nr:hypothetical protein SAMN05444342_4228 [Haladaptatus paucihalophilus DX253]